MRGGGGGVGVDLLEKVTFEQRLREVSRVSLAARTAHAKALRQECAWCVEGTGRRPRGWRRMREGGRKMPSGQRGCGEQITSGRLTWAFLLNDQLESYSNNPARGDAGGSGGEDESRANSVQQSCK